MPQIDFYIIKDNAHDAWLRYACRLVEKAYTMGLRIHIHTADENMTMQMDELLWIFRDRSFIPHQRESAPDELCAVTLNHDHLPEHREVLINLSHEVPEFYDQFERIVEVVGSNQDMIQQGRTRFRNYKDKGEQPQHHEITH